MVCPFCMYEKTEVYNSRRTKKLNEVWRRRRCLRCERQFTTEEQARPEAIIKVGIKGLPRSLPYSRTKLLLAIYRACDHRRNAVKSAEYLTLSIEQKLYVIAARQEHTVSKQDIIQIVLDTLRHYDASAYVKYLSYHQPDLDSRTLKAYLKQA